MAIEKYQVLLELNKLYRVIRKPSFDGTNKQNAPSIWFNSGKCDIYVSQSATQPANLSSMTLNTSETSVFGLKTISVTQNTIPKYISIVQNSGTTTEIVASGLQIEDLGSIS